MARRAQVGVAVTALSASFLAGVVVSGGLSAGSSAAEQPLRLAKAALRPATSCDQLREWYVDRALDQVTAWGWGNPYPVYWMDDVGGVADTAASGAALPSTRAEEAVGASDTGTNVQESGVDEPDTVKTDGSLLITVDGARLTTYDVSGGSPELLASIVLPDLDSAEILLSGTTVIAVGRDSTLPQRRAVPGTVFPGVAGNTRVITLDVTEPAAPVILDSRAFDADVVAVRQHGDVVRLVLSSGLPDLPFTMPRGGRRTEQAALEHNRQVVRESTVADWLPSVTTDDGGTAAALDCEDVALPREDAGLGTMTVVAFRAAEVDAADTTAVATSSQTAYLSQDSLFLASSPWSGWWGPAPMPLVGDTLGGVAEADGVTRLHAFGLDGTSTTYRASGEVEGQVASRWAMDAADGSLRLAVGPSVETGNVNSVVTMAERDGVLVETGRVDALGVGEQIKSVRWFDDLAVLVTFRQTDPLYAVDLSVAGDPRLLGELKIPGFSEYLHPIGGDRLLGVGQDATLQGSVRGAQIALFDIGDLTSPRRLDVVGFGRSTGAMAGQDPRQFTWLADRQTALTVLADWRTGTGSVVSVSVTGDGLETRSQQVEAGRDVSRLRLVPLDDGRVVLWTGVDVSFFAVSG